MLMSLRREPIDESVPQCDCDNEGITQCTYKIYDYDENGDHVEVDMPKRMRDFLEEIKSVCKKHNLSISHEDGHGAFIVDDYDEFNINWLFNALKAYKTEL